MMKTKLKTSPKLQNQTILKNSKERKNINLYFFWFLFFYLIIFLLLLLKFYNFLLLYFGSLIFTSIFALYKIYQKYFFKNHYNSFISLKQNSKIIKYLRIRYLFGTIFYFNIIFILLFLAFSNPNNYKILFLISGTIFIISLFFIIIFSLKLKLFLTGESKIKIKKVKKLPFNIGKYDAYIPLKEILDNNLSNKKTNNDNFKNNQNYILGNITKNYLIYSGLKNFDLEENKFYLINKKDYFNLLKNRNSEDNLMIIMFFIQFIIGGLIIGDFPFLWFIFIQVIIIMLYLLFTYILAKTFKKSKYFYKNDYKVFFLKDNEGIFYYIKKKNK